MILLNDMRELLYNKKQVTTHHLEVQNRVVQLFSLSVYQSAAHRLSCRFNHIAAINKHQRATFGCKKSN